MVFHCLKCGLLLQLPREHSEEMGYQSLRAILPFPNVSTYGTIQVRLTLVVIIWKIFLHTEVSVVLQKNGKKFFFKNNRSDARLSGTVLFIMKCFEKVLHIQNIPKYM